MRDRFSAVGTILERAIAARAFPGAAIEVGTATHAVWQQAFGALTYVPDARSVSS